MKLTLLGMVAILGVVAVVVLLTICGDSLVNHN
jgi:hypothetical protein